MAMVDYHLKFLATDAGVQGRISDRGVLKNFAMYYAMENKTLKFLPPPYCLNWTMKLTTQKNVPL